MHNDELQLISTVYHLRQIDGISQNPQPVYFCHKLGSNILFIMPIVEII